VPAAWFRRGRGRQRLVLQCPEDSGLAVSDLVDVATEQSLRHGGQVAELVQITARIRVSGADAVAVDMPDPTDVLAAEDDGDRACAELRDLHDAFQAAA
jgi:hypothetical protein